MSTLNDLDEITIDYDQRLEMQPIGENVQLGKQQQKQQQQVCHPKHTILIRGRGINLYGLMETFEATFPPSFVNVISEEQFFATLNSVNQFLKKVRKIIKKWWICGLFFICCTFGCSVWPSYLKNRKALKEFKELLEEENKQIYHKLGLHWEVIKIAAVTQNYVPEYAITIKFLDKHFCDVDL